MKRIPFDSGAILVVDKPLNWTSFDVVKKSGMQFVNIII
jgi:tRNA U55 pseudouridine synthase TruB